MAYTSELTQFIVKLKRDRPELESQQLAGRSLLWDKSVDPVLQDEWQQAGLPPKPYAYAPD